MQHTGLECARVEVHNAHVCFRFGDGSFVDVSPEVLSRSSLLLQALADSDQMGVSVQLYTPPGFLKSWLQCARLDSPRDEHDAQQLVQYLMVCSLLSFEHMTCRR